LDLPDVASGRPRSGIGCHDGRRVTAAGQTKRSSLSRQAGTLAFGSLATQASYLVLLMALTRLAPKSQLGGYQQLQLIYGILSPLLIAGIPAALLYFIPRSDDPARTRAWVGEAYVLLGSSGLLVSIAIAVWREPLAAALGNSALEGALLVYAPQPFFGFLGGVMATALVAVGRAGLAAAVGALSGALALVGVIGATLVQADATHMAAGLVLASACNALIATVVVQRTIGIAIRRHDLVRGIRRLLAYGLPLALTGLAGRLAWQFDRIVVSRQFSAALFAVYSVGAVELPLTSIVQQSVNAVMVPALTRHYAAGDITGMAALWRRAIRRTSLVLLPMFVFFMLTAGEVIRLLFGAGFEGSIGVFRIYLLLVPLRVATYGLITQAIGRTRINLVGSFVLLAANAVLVLALVGPLGLTGPALGTVLATFILAGYYLVRLRRVVGMSIRALFPWPLLAANLAISAAAGVPVVALLLADVRGPSQLVLAALVYAPTYLGLLLLARRLEPQEIDWLRRLLDVTLALPRRRLRARAQDGSV
jgi:O-antigen/teichoic acid export membrane protein